MSLEAGNSSAKTFFATESMKSPPLPLLTSKDHDVFDVVELDILPESVPQVDTNRLIDL